MMSFCWNLAALLLFLTPDLLPTSPTLLLTHAVPTSPPVTHFRILYVTGVGSDTEDYNEDYPEEKGVSPPNHNNAIATSLPTYLPNPKPCDYDPCQDELPPCSQLSAQSGCFCPGLSGDDKPPHPPHLKKLVPAGEGATVQWCAPASAVSGYRVVVEGRSGEPLLFGEHLRSGLVGDLEAGVKVCVEAVNDAGRSTPSEFSCMHYDSPEPTNLALTAGVISGGLGLLLLLTLTAVILWRRQACQKAEGNSTEGLGNPSYSTEGTL